MINSNDGGRRGRAGALSIARPRAALMTIQLRRYWTARASCASPFVARAYVVMLLLGFFNARYALHHLPASWMGALRTANLHRPRFADLRLSLDCFRCHFDMTLWH